MLNQCPQNQANRRNTAVLPADALGLFCEGKNRVVAPSGNVGRNIKVLRDVAAFMQTAGNKECKYSRSTSKLLVICAMDQFKRNSSESAVEAERSHTGAVRSKSCPSG